MLKEIFDRELKVAVQDGSGPWVWEEAENSCSDQMRHFNNDVNDVFQEYSYEYSDAWKHGTKEESALATFTAVMTEISNMGDASSEVLKHFFESGQLVALVRETEQFLGDQMALAKTGNALSQADIRKKVRANLTEIQKLLESRFTESFDEFERSSRLAAGRVGNLNDAVTRRRKISLPRAGRQKLPKSNQFKKMRFLESNGFSKALLVLDITPRILEIIEAEHRLQAALIEAAKFGGQSAGVAIGANFGAACRAIPARHPYLLIGKGVCVVVGIGISYALGSWFEETAEDFSVPIVEKLLDTQGTTQP